MCVRVCVSCLWCGAMWCGAVRQGSVFVTVRNSNKEKVEIATLKVGSYFGEIALMDRRRESSATVSAIVYCELYRLDYSAWDDVTKSFPQLAIGLTLTAQHR